MPRPLSQKAFRAGKGNLCPACQSTDIQAEMDWDLATGDVLGQKCQCLDCQATWLEFYRLDYYANLEIPEKETDGQLPRPEGRSL